MSNKSLAGNPQQITVLVTGGAGFIGSHTAVELLDAGYNVVILDDLSNSSPIAVKRIAQICGLREEGKMRLDADGFGLEVWEYARPAAQADEAAKGNPNVQTVAAFPALAFVEASILDRSALDAVFEAFDIDAIIHFAGFKAVGESVEKPWEYYWNNVAGTLILTDAARKHGVKNFVFSSSATVYGEAEEVPMTENSPKLAATNPYGQTKSMLEQVLTDLYIGDNEWNIALLRYFNPIGAHESGIIGEDPLGIPNNLVPYVAQVAVGKLAEVGVFGNDYPTPDGTGVRDYIHVVDLARGHVAALEWLGGKTGTDTSAESGSVSSADSDASASQNLDWGSIAGKRAVDGTRSGVGIFNLGTGKGSSVLDVINAFSRACGKDIPYAIKPRRAGDIATSFASCEKARKELGWTAQYDLDRMCQDSWRWQSGNPNGYSG